MFGADPTQGLGIGSGSHLQGYPSEVNSFPTQLFQSSPRVASGLAERFLLSGLCGSGRHSRNDGGATEQAVLCVLLRHTEPSVDKHLWASEGQSLRCLLD